MTFTLFVVTNFSKIGEYVLRLSRLPCFVGRMRQSYQQNMVSEIRPLPKDSLGTYLAYHVLLIGLAHAHAVVTRLSFPLPQESLGTRLDEAIHLI